MTQGLCGCDSTELDVDAGADGALPLEDASLMDAAPEEDAGTDAGADAGADAAVDAAPPLPDTGPPTCDDPDTHYRDLDGDGFGDPTATVESCDPVAGFVLQPGDCDDGCSACHDGAAEMCDGRDGDCDGSIDETETCAPGTVVDCTTSCGSAGTGACTDACGLPTGEACVPPSETCDGTDDDCDGTTDEGFGCAAGSTAACTTSCGSTGTGTCSLTCGAAAPASCTPPSETCNGMDDDCDGAADQTFACVLGSPVSCATSCGTTGTGVCTGACGIPTGAACLPPAEVCNGMDDDCDGARDETFACAVGDTVACTTSCGTTGSGTCSGSCAVPTGGACSPPSETCNGVDDDCDGDVDEGFSCMLGDTVSCTTSCGTRGLGTCTGMCERPTGGACRPPAETCNGLDDDCDGQRDETFTCVRASTVACTTSCGSTGSGTCTSSCGLPSASSCNPPTESCSYADDDCDGRVDEGRRTVGEPLLQPSHSVALAHPIVGSMSFGAAAVWRQYNSIFGNYFYRYDNDGRASGRVRVDGDDDFDFATNRADHMFYAYLDGNNIRLQRFESTPTTSDPYRWTRFIPASAVEVHISPGSVDSYIYWRETDGDIQRMRFSNSSGAVSGLTRIGSSTQRFAVNSNGFREHLVAWVGSFGITYKVYNLDSQVVTGLFLTSGRTVRGLAIAGDYRSLTQRQGLVVAYAVSGPEEIRLFSRRETGTTANQRLGSRRLAQEAIDYSNIDVEMEAGHGVVAIIEQAGVTASHGRPRAYRLSRPRSGATFGVQSLLLPGGSVPHEGVSVLMTRPEAGLPDRVLVRPDGANGSSIPLGC
ncbi:MAG: putative metal-binding motif-containing protein [Sandaracinaceae bacterium]